MKFSKLYEEVMQESMNLLTEQEISNIDFLIESNIFIDIIKKMTDGLSDIFNSFRKSISLSDAKKNREILNLSEKILKACENRNREDVLNLYKNAMSIAWTIENEALKRKVIAQLEYFKKDYKGQKLKDTPVVLKYPKHNVEQDYHQNQREDDK